MWHSFVQGLAKVMVGPMLFWLGLAGYNMQALSPQMATAEMQYTQESAQYGATQPFAGNTYNLAGAGAGSSDTSITLTSLTIKQTGQQIQTSDLVGTGGTFYITLEPGNNTKQEIIGCTGVTQGASSATLTGCTRGLSPISPYTASSSLRFVHAGGTQAIFSDPPQLFAQYGALANANSWTGVNTFSSTSQPVYDGAPVFTNSLALIDKAYADALSIVGAPTSTESSLGVAVLAPASKTGLSTASTTTGAPYVLQNKYATSSPSSLCGTLPCIPVGRSSDGKISPNFIATSSSDTYNFGGTVVIASSSIGILNVGTLNATSSLLFQGASVQKFGGSGADGALNISSGTTTLNLGGKSVFIKNYTSLSITGTGALAFSNPNAGGTLIIINVQDNATISASDAIDASGMGSAVGTNANVFFGGFSTSTGAAGGGTSCSATCTAAGGGGGGNNTATTTAILDNLNLRQIFLADGSAGGNADTGGLAGRGGGALLFEIGGSWNFTGSISVAGIAGTNGASNVTGAGGGAGGSLLALFNTLISNAGTFIITGGIGGSSNAGAHAGGNPGNSSTVFGQGFGGTGGSETGGSGTLHSGGGGGGQYFQTQNGSSGTSFGEGGGGASGIATTSLNFFFQ